MKILVTGAGGCIASHLCDCLIERGHEVRGMVHYSAESAHNLKEEVERFSGDVRFLDECREAAEGVDAIAHLAALIHVDRSRKYPQMFWKTNVEGTMNLLEAARHEDASFLYMSTCEILGNIPTGKADEEYSFKQPRSPYAASKHAAESYCHAYYATYGIGSIARGFNITGPRQKMGSKGAVIPKWIDRLRRGQPPLLYGSGYQTRDYTDARDIVRGLALLLELNPKGELFHLCSGVERRMVDIAWKLIEAYDSRLHPVCVEGRPGELLRSVGDNSKAKRVLGWVPEIPFEETLRDMIEHICGWG